MNLGSRWLGLTGVAFVVVAFLGLSAVGDTPAIDDATTSEIVDHWTEVANGELSSALLVLCVPLLLIFGGVVLARHHRPGPFSFDIWSFLFGVGLTVVAVGLVAEAAGVAAIADAADSGFSEMIAEIYVGGARVHMVWAVGLSVTLLGAAGMYLPRSGLERALGWIALAGGILGLLPEPVGLLGVVASVLWVLTTSVAIAARPA